MIVRLLENNTQSCGAAAHSSLGTAPTCSPFFVYFVVPNLHAVHSCQFVKFVVPSTCSPFLVYLVYFVVSNPHWQSFFVFFVYFVV